MRSPFKISITVFLWLASSLLMLVFLVISIGALNSIGEIARLSSAVRQKNLPEILENQRSFINLESLRGDQIVGVQHVPPRSEHSEDNDYPRLDLVIPPI